MSENSKHSHKIYSYLSFSSLNSYGSPRLRIHICYCLRASIFVSSTKIDSITSRDLFRQELSNKSIVSLISSDTLPPDFPVYLHL